MGITSVVVEEGGWLGMLPGSWFEGGGCVGDHWESF